MCIDYGTEKREGEKEKDFKYIVQESGDCYVAFFCHWICSRVMYS